MRWQRQRASLKLLDTEPRRTVNAEVHQHLLAPQRPAFVENRVREKAAPFPRMPVLDDELEMMPGIRLVRARQPEAEVLLTLGAFVRLGGLGDAQVVHPEDAALSFLEGAGLGIGRGRETGAA